MTQIKQVLSTDIEKILPLFNEYRRFYRQELNAKSYDFLFDRIQKNQSVIFYIEESNKVIGFVQIYPSFSSIGLGSTWLLNDLFVLPEYRRKKVATKLIEKTINYARETNAINVHLATQISNTNAQELYKKLGFKKDNDFFYFNFLLNK